LSASVIDRNLTSEESQKMSRGACDRLVSAVAQRLASTTAADKVVEASELGTESQIAEEAAEQVKEELPLEQIEI